MGERHAAADAFSAVAAGARENIDRKQARDIVPRGPKRGTRFDSSRSGGIELRSPYRRPLIDVRCRPVSLLAALPRERAVARRARAVLPRASAVSSRARAV